jgi:hypothetical protein
MSQRVTCKVLATVKISGHTYQAAASGRPKLGGYITLRPRFSAAAAKAITGALRHGKHLVVRLTATVKSGTSTGRASGVVRLRR